MFIESLRNTDWFGVFVGTFLGGISSLVITHIYFIKGKVLERLFNFISFNIEKAMLPNIYPNYFNSNPKIHLKFSQSLQKDPGVPQLSELIIPTNEIIPGEEYKLLFRVVDHDLDFNMSEHTKVKFFDRELTVKDEIFGFMSLEFSIPQTASQAKYRMNFSFVDVKNNEGGVYCRFFSIAIAGRLWRQLEFRGQPLYIAHT